VVRPYLSQHCALVLAVAGALAAVVGVGCREDGDCVGVAAEGEVQVVLLEHYDETSVYWRDGFDTPRIARDKPSCQGVDGLADGEDHIVLVGRPVYRFRECDTYLATVVDGPPVTGTPHVPVEDDTFISDTILHNTLLVQEGEIAIEGCEARWLWLLSPLHGELFRQAVPGDHPPRLVTRVITFEEPCTSSTTLPAGVEACADVWAAEIRPAP
jgi:hypothetical protein